MPKPVCVGCRCFYRPTHNGFVFMEGKPDNNPKRIPADELRGHRHPEAWTPYKLWNGDLWACPDCGHEIVVGVIGPPLAEHYEKNFAETVEQFPPRIQVNDC